MTTERFGVLSDPQAGWPGDYSFAGNQRLVELDKKQETIYNKIVAPKYLKFSQEWPALRFPVLLQQCGLEKIRLYSFSHCLSYSDQSWEWTAGMSFVVVGQKK